MYHGIMNVYKEPGYTSHDVVARLRGILKQKKSDIPEPWTLRPRVCFPYALAWAPGSATC